MRPGYRIRIYNSRQKAAYERLHFWEEAIDRNHPLWQDFHTKKHRGSGRLTIIVAKHAPVALVIRRQPTKLWSFFRWDLITDELTEGGSYKGVLWPLGCDISWDGRYWAFYVSTTSGICAVPDMQPVAEWENDYGWGEATPAHLP